MYDKHSTGPEALNEDDLNAVNGGMHDVIVSSYRGAARVAMKPAKLDAEKAGNLLETMTNGETCGV